MNELIWHKRKIPTSWTYSEEHEAQISSAQCTIKLSVKKSILQDLNNVCGYIAITASCASLSTIIEERGEGNTARIHTGNEESAVWRFVNLRSIDEAKDTLVKCLHDIKDAFVFSSSIK